MANRKLQMQMLEKLRQADDAYYNQADPIMDDAEYDDYRDEYNRLFPASPYVSVGADIPETSEWKKAEHRMPMGSLDKVKTKEEFVKWCNDHGIKIVVLEDKLDGFSLELIYEEGPLTQGITRGKGDTNEGEDITANVLKMKNVKPTLPDKFTGSLRAEVFIFADDFDAINKELVEQGRQPLKNPRNGAAGVAKRYNGTGCEHLSLLYYDVQSDEYDFETEERKMRFIGEVLGLPVCFWKKATIEEAIRIYEEYEDHKRAETPYDIDGLVAKANDLEIQEQLGISNNRPRGQIAWKFKAMKAKTKMVGVEWSVGGNRRINPVALLKGVPIGGVTASRATLHNLEIFRKLNLGKDDEVMISRRNDVIPYVEEVTNHVGAKFEIPTHCPICKSELVEDGKFLYCMNDACEGLGLGNLNKWIGALDIKEIGGKIVEGLYQSGKVKEPADFYRVSAKDFGDLDRGSEKVGQKIVDNLRAKMEITLPVFIGGLNMAHFSNATAKTLMEAGFDTIVKMAEAETIDLVEVKGIELTTAQKIRSGLKAKATVIQHLFEAGIKIKTPEKVESLGNEFDGKSFCFTGAIQTTNPATGKRFKRPEMELLVVQHGGTVAPVGKKLDYLVMVDPDSSSSKAVKARELGINILSEETFFKMIGM